MEIWELPVPLLYSVPRHKLRPSMIKGYVAKNEPKTPILGMRDPNSLTRFQLSI